MNRIEHKYFLLWLLFISMVSFLTITGFYLGYLNIAFNRDPTYITHLLGISYILAETYMGWKIWRISKEYDKILETHRLYKDSTSTGLPKTESNLLTRLMRSLSKKGNSDSEMLLNNLDDRISANNQGPFFAELMVRIGLFGTIVGLIIAFLPFIEQAFDSGTTTKFSASQIQLIIGSLFQGVSTAFFTTAMGLFGGTLLIISSRIYEVCQSLVMDRMTIIAETIIKPRMDK